MNNQTLFVGALVAFCVLAWLAWQALKLAWYASKRLVRVLAWIMLVALVISMPPSLLVIMLVLALFKRRR